MIVNSNISILVFAFYNCVYTFIELLHIDNNRSINLKS